MKIQKSRVFFSFPGKIYVFEVISPLDNFSREKAIFRSRAGSWQAAGCARSKERTAGLPSGFVIRLSPPRSRSRFRNRRPAAERAYADNLTNSPRPANLRACGQSVRNLQQVIGSAVLCPEN